MNLWQTNLWFLRFGFAVLSCAFMLDSPLELSFLQTMKKFRSLFLLNQHRDASGSSGGCLDKRNQTPNFPIWIEDSVLKSPSLGCLGMFLLVWNHETPKSGHKHMWFVHAQRRVDRVYEQQP